MGRKANVAKFKNLFYNPVSIHLVPATGKVGRSTCMSSSLLLHLLNLVADAKSHDRADRYSLLVPTVDDGCSRGRGARGGVMKAV